MGTRGRKGDPLYAARRTLHTGSDLPTDKQRQRLTALFADGDLRAKHAFSVFGRPFLVVHYQMHRKPAS